MATNLFLNQKSESDLAHTYTRVLHYAWERDIPPSNIEFHHLYGTEDSYDLLLIFLY